MSKVTEIWGKVSDFISGAQNVTNTRPVRSTSIIKYEQSLTRMKQDVGKWRRALIAAESNLNPNRTEYYRMIKDILVDAHLSSVIDQRENAVLCRKIFFYDKNGEINEEQTKRFKKSWFKKQNGYILRARQMGFNLVDYGQLVDDAFPDLKIVPHQYVKPELGIVVANTGDITGIPIDDPKYAKWNIFFGETHDLGLLMKAAPWALWKKAVVAYWSEYCEKFGMPMRVGKTNIQDETLKKNMEESLKNMGSAFWAMMGQDDEIQLLETFNTAAYDIYDKFIERGNSEISKLELCQTGTTDEKSYVGSANVHQDVLSDVVEAECAYLIDNLNEKVIPFLNKLGFALPEGGYFGIDYKETPSMEVKAKIVASFMPYVKFDQKYLEDEFDIVIEEMGDVNKEQSGETDAKKSLGSNYQNITNSYKSICKTCGGFHNEVIEGLFSDTEKEDLINGVAIGVYTIAHLPEWYYIKLAEAFKKEVQAGFEIEISMVGTDQLLLNELIENVYVFSGAKTYQQVRDIQALLVKYPHRSDLFLKHASALFDDYNKDWLATELITAKGTARSAKNWNGIERDKYILKYLTYETVGDSRVRPTHAELDGITRPVDDQFWDSYYPPNGWRCRCSTTSHEDVKQLTPMKDFKKPDDVPDIFLFNPGKDKIIFSPEHPYFKVAKNDRALAQQNFNLPMPNGA
jgi:SPP1 gp7 family putative phage head morphogenesis protein